MNLTIIKRCSTIRAGPTIPSCCTWSTVQSCGQVPQRGTKENCNWLRTGQHGWPLDVHRELTIICMTISPGSKWRRDWIHHYLYLTCWMHQAVCLNYWHTAQPPMHTPQDMPQEVSSQSKSRTDYGRHKALHRAMTTLISISHQVGSKIRFKRQIKIHLMEQRGLLLHKQTQ